IHTPHLSDRSLSLENANYVMENARDLAQEISFKPDGIIQKRSEAIINQVVDFLEEIAQKGLKTAISEGYFADIRRPKDGGKGGDGVVLKATDYRNPFMDQMQQELGRREADAF
ncbi:MAG: D-lysine 5,6-aminomutase subunit alpha, partial [Firmicutes bacterium]|nr:D-lysine 5,6-aminomutase subunit alpha [Bacillota bacterium]